MDLEKVINELKRAWDALEGLSVNGYATRARIQAAQEGILAVYNIVKKAMEEAKDDPADEPPEE